VRLPEFWTGIMKFGLVLIIVQNFKPVGPRISEISPREKKTSCVKQKSFQKLLFSGGLKNICSKTEVLPKTIVYFGQTKKCCLMLFQIKPDFDDITKHGVIDRAHV